MERYTDPTPDEYIYKLGAVTVKNMVDNQTGQRVCVKQYYEDQQFVGEDEVKIYNKLPSHPNIINLIDHFQTQGYYALVLELGHKNLMDQLNNYIINPKYKYHLIKGCIEAVAFCHEHGIVHNDNDSTNFMCLNGDNVKLIDFGNAYDIVSRHYKMNRGKFYGKLIDSELTLNLVN